MFLSGNSYLADVNHTLRDVLERGVLDLVVPPGNTTLAYKTLQMFISHFLMFCEERLSQAVMMFSLGKRWSSPCLNFPRQLSSVS